MKTSELEKEFKKVRDLIILTSTRLGLDQNGIPTGNGILSEIKETKELKKRFYKLEKDFYSLRALISENEKGNITIHTLKTWGQTIKGILGTASVVLGIIIALKALKVI